VVAAALGASLTTAVGTYGVTRLTSRQADKRALRDAKRERLRRAYVELLGAGRTFGALARLGFFLTLDQLQAQSQEQVATAVERVEDSLVAVMLETDAKLVLSAYEEVRRAFDAILLAMRRDERGGPDPEQRAQDVQAEHGKLTKALEELQQRAREQLASLERPM